MDHQKIKIVKNLFNITDKTILHLCAKLQFLQLYFVGVVMKTIY